MCLIAVAWRVHPRFPLLLIANRDEFHARPTAPAAAHPEDPQVFGGRDLEKGGSWLQICTRGRLAAVTNVRRPAPAPRNTVSRGKLVTDFVRGSEAAETFVARVRANAECYARFNLLAFDGRVLAHVGTYGEARDRLLAPGVYLLSNADLDTPWPKAERLRAHLQDWLAEHTQRTHTIAQVDIVPLLAALADRQCADDAALPDTGVGRERERFLSSPFIVGADYGTRCSSVVLFDGTGFRFIERRFAADGSVSGQTDVWLPAMHT